jgi:hypothetical protein
MNMHATAVQREDSSVFHYGFLSSRISGVLNDYIETNQITPDSRRTLEDAYSLLMDITTAQRMFGADKETATPSERQLDAFGCALEVIVANSTSFGVKDVAELTQLFRSLYRTLEEILSETQPRPNVDVVRKTRLFFKNLAERMLAQLSIQEEQELSVA